MTGLSYEKVTQGLQAMVLAFKDCGAEPHDVRRALQEMLKGYPDYLTHAAGDALHAHIEQLILRCIPGGSICDPQQVADALRGWAYTQDVVPGSSVLVAIDVIAERRRQVMVEGFTPASDDRKSEYGRELAAAAACYAIAGPHSPMPDGWPWSAVWWKPASRRRNRVKAAALLLASIEQEERAVARSGATT